MEPPSAKRPGVALIVILLVSIAGLWTIDVFLARLESAELKGEARRRFDNGTRLLSEGHTPQAVDLLRKAYALDPTNQAYGLRLAAALVSSDKLDDAQRLLTEILERSPNDGEPNLIEARLMARNGRYSEASAYYHRAIYGAWDANAAGRRVQVRLELARMLAADGSPKDLLAELLPLESDATADLPAEKQVAHLYLLAGSAPRAEGVYRTLIRGNPHDAEAYAGLGDAELAQGDYRAAQIAFEDAIRESALQPSETAGLKPRVALAAEMAGLDPTVRRLSSLEKFNRSVRILQLARDALAACAKTDAAAEMIVDADKVLARKTGLNVNNELAEDRLSKAERLWTSRLDTCGPSTSTQEEPLRLIMVKLAQ